MVCNSFESTYNFIFQSYHYVQVDASVVCSVSADALMVCQPTHWPMRWKDQFLFIYRFVDAFTGEKSWLFMACLLYSHKDL